jgi:hypothetical protein
MLLFLRLIVFLLFAYRFLQFPPRAEQLHKDRGCVSPSQFADFRALKTLVLEQIQDLSIMRLQGPHGCPNDVDVIIRCRGRHLELGDILVHPAFPLLCTDQVQGLVDRRPVQVTLRIVAESLLKIGSFDQPLEHNLEDIFRIVPVLRNAFHP